MSAENGGKPLDGRAPSRTPPLGELTALPETTQLVGRGLLPLIKNPTPLSALRSHPQ